MSKIKIIGIIVSVVLIILVVGMSVFTFLTLFSSGRPENSLGGVSIEENSFAEDISKLQNAEFLGDIKAVLHTEKGDIEIMLADNSAAEKFIGLQNSGAFSGAAFNVLAKDRFIQTGIYGEAFSLDKNEMLCVRGAACFAADGENAFPSIVIITGDDLSEELEGKAAVFGQVVSGMEIADEISLSENSGYTGGFSAAEPIIINDIEIIYP